MAQRGAYILGCVGQSLTPDERAFFRAADPWGFILFARNIADPEQLKRLTGQLREAVGRNAMITIDQEGGRVQRMRAPHWREWMPPLDQMRAAGPAHAARAMYLRYRIIAAELLGVGIDSNCAPMADVATSETHPFLQNRCYGDDTAIVVGAAQAASRGLLDGGVLPVLKHMPGHGRATVDSHKDLPRVSATARSLRATDFAAFRALNDLPMAMTAHIVFEAFDSKPATTSMIMQQLIREEIGFGGLLMTDDISMQALSGTVAERSAAAIRAGCDVVLHCNGVLDEMHAVADAAGQMSLTSALRAKAALAMRTPAQSVDIAALEAEFEELLTA
ncbi:beta-N-acetylhexosaminidase [Nereida sp. MMG025]|uniref:beta-N-acetylhexosaminidase n=1 Tax=Nereida sp. MMG025 TaxID=2909981 RepID=UPI00351D09B8|nr:beta-N-acetylhexosaminidase [Nereida sp. MMG025]